MWRGKGVGELQSVLVSTVLGDTRTCKADVGDSLMLQSGKAIRQLIWDACEIFCRLWSSSKHYPDINLDVLRKTT